MRAAASSLVLLAILSAAHAHAVDGVIAINQVRALAGGVTPGDPPGFPVLISAPGSYRLTGDLTVPDAFYGIFIDASFVHIDLNGFTIRGPNTWPGGTAECSAPGSGVGIYSSRGGIAVSNGRVFGMGAQGVFLSGEANRVERVIVEQSCATGLVVGDASLVIDSIARRNRGNGFTLEPNSRISGSIADSNGGAGITMPQGFGTIERCTVSGNVDSGLFASLSSLIRRNQINDNGGNGVRAGIGSLILDSVINGHPQTGITGATAASAQVGSGGNVVSYAPGAGGYFYVQHLYCDLDNLITLCAP